MFVVLLKNIELLYAIGIFVFLNTIGPKKSEDCLYNIIKLHWKAFRSIFLRKRLLLTTDAVNSISSSQVLLLYVAGRGYTIYIK